MNNSNYKIAYFVQTDIQHLPPVMCVYPFLGGIVFTTRQKILNFIQKKYPDVEVVKLKNRLQIQREIIKRRIRLVIYPSYIILYTGVGVQIFHSVCDKIYIENPKILLYDLILFPGKKSMLKIKNTGLLEKIPRWKIVGYPKFDPLINEQVLPESLFNNKKKTILYAPTWISSDTKMRVLKFSEFGESSLPRLGLEIVNALHKDYNLIIKYHNRAYRSKNTIYDQINNLIRKLNAEDCVKCIWDDNILPYMKMSDLLISDISTVCYEWFHFNKPILFANPSPEHYAPSNNMYSNTYAWQAGDIINDFSQIRTMVEKNLNHDYYKEKRNEIFNEAFYLPDGKATERQVEEIKNFYHQIEKTPYFSFIFFNYFKKRCKSFQVKWLNKFKRLNQVLVEQQTKQDNL
jgi:hypothetical protein